MDDDDDEDDDDNDDEGSGSEIDDSDEDMDNEEKLGESSINVDGKLFVLIQYFHLLRYSICQMKIVHLPEYCFNSSAVFNIGKQKISFPLAIHNAMF